MKMSVREICHKVMKRFQLLSLFIGSKILSQAMQYHIMDVIGINRHPIQVKRGLWCKWEQSSPGLFELNIGGSARDGQIIWGGVVRDDNGEFIAGFSTFYGGWSSLNLRRGYFYVRFFIFLHYLLRVSRL